MSRLAYLLHILQVTRPETWKSADASDLIDLGWATINKYSHLIVTKRGKLAIRLSHENSKEETCQKLK